MAGEFPGVLCAVLSPKQRTVAIEALGKTDGILGSLNSVGACPCPTACRFVCLASEASCD